MKKLDLHQSRWIKRAALVKKFTFFSVLSSSMQDLLMIYSKSESFVLQQLKGVGCAFLFFILNLHQWALKQILILSFRQQLRHRSCTTLLTFKKKGIVFWEDDPSQSIAYELATFIMLRRKHFSTYGKMRRKSMCYF